VGPLLKLTSIEMRLFLREPITVVFTLALPLMVLYLLGGVFGSAVDPNAEFVVYRGFPATSWYTPAYVAVAVSGFAVISAPRLFMNASRETSMIASSGVTVPTAKANITVAA